MSDLEHREREVIAREVIDEPPPFLGTWPRVYAAVLIYLTTLIVLFYALTRAFAR